jgi:hypothetical protein
LDLERIVLTATAKLPEERYATARALAEDLARLDGRDPGQLSDDELFALLPAPDFPGGGQIISAAADLRDAYRSGRGSLKVRARWVIEDLARGQWQLVITELPHGVSAARVLEGDTLKSAVPIGTDSAARAEAIAVLREDAPLRPLSSLTMQLDSPDGPEQVRVTMRGGVVDTQVTTTNGALADRLRLQTADLQDALGRHGLDTDTVRVQQPARTSENDAVRQALSDRGEVLRAAGASAGQQGGTFEQSPRDRPPARSQAERDPRQADDDPHQQRRRENRQEQR